MFCSMRLIYSASLKGKINSRFWLFVIIVLFFLLYLTICKVTSGVNHSEALPVRKVLWEEIGFEKGKGRRETAW